MTGREVSVLSFVDGKTIKIMTSAQDHKRAKDGDQGLNLSLIHILMFFSEELGRTAHESYSYNLELFKEIKRFYTYRDQLGMEAFFLNTAGNVIGFVPFGFILPVISRGGKKWYVTVLMSFLFSLCIELTQLICKVGSFDVDDLFLNTVGGALGFLLIYLWCFIRLSLIHI